MKTTQKKLEAPRANGRKGGPKTPEGKRKVSQNARIHGLTGELALTEEERPDFEAFQRELQEELQPNGALLRMLFDEVVASGWQVKVARRCVQTEVHRMVGASGNDGAQGPPGACTSRTAMILAGHPYTLTPHQLKGRMDFLDEVGGELAGQGKLAEEWKEPVSAAFGGEFWQSLQEWGETDRYLRYSMLLYDEMEEKAEKYDLERIPKQDLLTDEQVAGVARAVRAMDRRQMLAKLMEVKQQALHEALNYAVGVEVGEAAANGKDRLDLFLRYQTTAKREFYRALGEYERRTALTTKV